MHTHSHFGPGVKSSKKNSGYYLAHFVISTITLEIEARVDEKRTTMMAKPKAKQLKLLKRICTKRKSERVFIEINKKKSSSAQEIASLQNETSTIEKYLQS